MQHFSHDGFDLAYLDEGEGDPVLLIHGFASNTRVNWVSPGWVKTLTEAGYRAIALDNRGHGASSKSHRSADYHPDKMAADAAALLDHLRLERAHVMGYSMGARVAAFMALAFPEKVATLVFGGLGIGMVEGVGEWDTIAAALTAADPATITDPRAKMFRAFADQTKSDRQALAACIETSRQLLAREDVARIVQPTLVAVGTTDDIAGSPDELAALMANATAFAIEGRDHMLSVGDRAFKKRTLAFFEENPL
ncbi:alpha/beta fold hydrolase [Nitratireductor sp. CAU 1489]|uniref:Alpha/beta fold hydrolase n=1 Tax=Nitratireductor arenosus TaxID=2682096 RepID=A0A844QJ32_9HYPH|nr:alpha/beta hydrolase [Nitratireductor arenosus]MVA97709.1 alpha/beta fold hydrolase [Nitratireductor arenosus]